MTIILPDAQRFSFASRPIPVPGDLRINWRVALVLMMLGASRAKRASLAKLHVLNDAVRSRSARHQIEQMLSGDEPLLNWQVRVEPAFGRAIDYVVGERFAEWVRVAQRSGLQLNKAGSAALEAMEGAEDVLLEEKEFLRTVGSRISEQFVSRILDGPR